MTTTSSAAGSAPVSDTNGAAYRHSRETVLRWLETDPERGLSGEEAQRRLERYGRNALKPETRVPAWRRFLAQFQSVLVLLLLAAAAVSTGTWLYQRESPAPYEALAILAVVFLNALLGYFQEARAESAVAAIAQLTAAHAQVLRAGVRLSLEAELVVPGDILLVEAGDAVSADARVLESTSLQTAEAALTGESVPVDKSDETITEEADLADRANMLFAGTVVTYGRGRGVVTATGMRTEVGRIAGLLREVTSEATPLQKQLDRVGKLLGVAVVVIAVVVVSAILLTEGVERFGSWPRLLVFGIALAVAAVPEALPATVTAVLAIGVQRMARRNAIVRHLSAVETLGSADVIASDKTGTLTKNEMTVRTLASASGEVEVEGSGYEPQGKFRTRDGADVTGALRAELEAGLRVAALANNAALRQQDGRWLVHGDPTEGALLVAAQKYGLSLAELTRSLPRSAELPFSSERKRMSTVHGAPGAGARVLCSKGAPDVLLERCAYELEGAEPVPLTAARRSRILRESDALASRGLRTLGLARRELPAGQASTRDAEQLERDLTFVGLVGMFDPPRDEVRTAVARAHNAGIRTLMITGDHPTTAGVIARDLGMAQEARVVTGRELSSMSSAELAQTVHECNVYARVDPEHKLRIVQALARQGAVVAMTGDGVNDAPALKTADIGVAMGITGTDVSKQAADMVLADDNFASIVAAVEEGRAIFANIRTFLRYLLSSNSGEIMTMFFGVLLAKPLGLQSADGHIILPVVATQLLWINLLTDGAPAIALGLEPADPLHMTRPPRRKSEGVITPSMWADIVFVGAVMASVTLIALEASLPGGFFESRGSSEHAQTRAFTTLTLCQFFNVLNSRSSERSAFERLWTNHWLWIALLTSGVLQVAVIYLPPLQRAFSTTPLTQSDWLACAALSSCVLWASELKKLVQRAWRTA